MTGRDGARWTGEVGLVSVVLIGISGLRLGSQSSSSEGDFGGDVIGDSGSKGIWSGRSAIRVFGNEVIRDGREGLRRTGETGLRFSARKTSGLDGIQSSSRSHPRRASVEMLGANVSLVSLHRGIVLEDWE